MGMFDIKTEKQLVKDIESIGFYYTKAVPHLHYDQYYFERDLDTNGIYTIVVEYNGESFSLAYGVDYRVSMINKQFELSYDEVLQYLQDFATTHSIRPIVDNPNE